MDNLGPWTQETLEEYITNQVEESLNLEYKGAGALARTESNKREITKDVSAMANSAGGVLIFGISEYNDSNKQHLPEKIDPVDATQFSREWLEQVIANIQPRVQNLKIFPVRLSTSDTHVAYVVEIPQSNIAHQATDKRYYKRYNFQSVPMDDYEINDIRNRQQFPKLQLHLKFKVTRSWIRSDNLGIWKDKLDPGRPTTREALTLQGEMINTGSVYAHYVNCRIMYPPALLDEIFLNHRGATETITIEGIEYFVHDVANTKRDILDYETLTPGVQTARYGPTWFNPILPSQSHRVSVPIRFEEPFVQSNFSGLFIHWEIYADNAPMERGSVLIESIPLVFEDLTTRR